MRFNSRVEAGREHHHLYLFIEFLLTRKTVKYNGDVNIAVFILLSLCVRTPLLDSPESARRSLPTGS